MADLQKNIIEKYLKEQKKTKRELAGFLKIKENSINRTLKNPNISIRKLERIAEFLGVEMRDLLFGKSVAEELKSEFKNQDLKEGESQITINNLSEALNRSSRTIESLVKIISENNLMIRSKS
jgi:transcriptional regulator with XRE-family HTH domain